MKKRIFHKILIPALVVMLMTPFYFTEVKADTYGGNFSVTTRVEFIRGTTQNGGYYDYTSNIITTVNFYMPFTGQFKLYTDGTNPIYQTGRASVEGAELLSVDDQGLGVTFQMSSTESFTYTQSYDYRIGYSMNIYGRVVNGSYANGTVIQYIDGIEEQLNQVKVYIDGIETSLNNIESSLNYFNDIPIYSYQAYKAFGGIGTLQDFSYAGSDANKYMNKCIYMYSLENAPFNNKYLIQIPAGQTLHVIGYFSTNTGANRVRLINSSGTVYNFSTEILLNLNEMFLAHYYYKNNTDGNLWVMIQPATNNYRVECIPIYVGLNVPSSLGSDLGISFSDSYTIKLDNIFNSINNLINGDSNSNSIVNANNSKNDQLNESVTQYDQVENQFKESFSTSMNQISKPDLSNIVSAAAWYTTQLTSLFNASGSFQIIYVLPLVLGIALFFIGRGAIAFRQSSNQETRWVETVKDDNGFTTRHGTIRSETVRGKGRYK